ncbi:MAG: hypothetical protein VX574_03605 [Myxococcota bacterium]|nr:hypothetical protein [Myxococcota bacterium]
MARPKSDAERALRLWAHCSLAPYLLAREIVALSESRRTESYGVRTTIFDGETERRVGEMLLNHATLKESYAGYA